MKAVTVVVFFSKVGPQLNSTAVSNVTLRKISLVHAPHYKKAAQDKQKRGRGKERDRDKPVPLNVFDSARAPLQGAGCEHGRVGPKVSPVINDVVEQ